MIAEDSRHILSAPSHQFAAFLRAGSGVDEGMRHVKASCDGRITRTRDRFERMRVGEGCVRACVVVVHARRPSPGTKSPISFFACCTEVGDCLPIRTESHATRRYLWGFLTPPVVGADLRAPLVASCLRGALPPVDLRAVCLVLANVSDVWGVVTELRPQKRIRWMWAGWDQYLH